VIGLLVFGLLFAYVALFYYLTKILPSRAQKIAAIVVGVAIPFWDLPIGYLSYRLQCHEHGGLQVFADSRGTDSILFDPGVGYRPEYLAKKYGFKKIEYRSSSRVEAYTITEHGIEKSSEANPTSAHKIAYTGNQVSGWSVSRGDWTLSRTDTGKVIARHSEFAWNGMWWQKAIPSGAPDAHCHAGPKDHDAFMLFASKGIR
jgi:hypothetical protein